MLENLEDLKKVNEENKLQLYTKDEVLMLVRRKIYMTQQSFFERYGVNNLEELDNLVNKAKEFEINQNKKDNLEKLEYEIQNEMVLNDKQIYFALSLISYFKKDNINFKKDKGSLFVLKGNEGVGKKYFAKIIHDILSINNIVDKNIITIDASEFLYLPIENAFNKEKGSFIIIDNLDLLLEKNMIFKEEKQKELLNELMFHLNLNLNDSYVCLLGKENPINEFLSKYRIYKNKIVCNLNFDSYNINKLSKILCLTLKENNYDIESIDFENVKEFVEILSKEESFNNAYTVIEYAKKIIEYQNKRTIECGFDKKIIYADLKNALDDLI